MPSITSENAAISEVAGGVDTHQDTHTAAVIDMVGRVLGTEQFPATSAGYAALLAWMRSFGRPVRVGVEGTGAYGAGLVRLLCDERVEVVEVDRPDRKTRRFQGKSDPIDAVQAAKTALAGERTGTPKQRDGRIEALRNLRVARRSAVDQRADAQRQIKTLIVTAPEGLRDRLRGLPARELIATCATLRPDPADAAAPATAAKIALRSLARRHQRLTAEITDLDELLEPLVTAINPRLVTANGVGTDVAGQLLVTAGENHDRLRSEAAFAMLCGVAPIPRLVRQDHPAPPEPRRRPPSQRRPLPDRALPPALGPPHPRLHGTTHQAGQVQEGDHPLPQTLHRPRALPDHHHKRS